MVIGTAVQGVLARARLSFTVSPHCWIMDLVHCGVRTVTDSHTHAHTSDKQSVRCCQTFRGEVVPAGESLPACTCKESGREEGRESGGEG